jgi:hypothetical protein
VTPPDPPKIIVAKDVSITANEVIVPTAEENPETKVEASAVEASAEAELPKSGKIE